MSHVTLELLPSYLSAGEYGTAMTTAKPFTPFFHHPATIQLDYRNIKANGVPGYTGNYYSLDNDNNIVGLNCEFLRERYKVETDEETESGRPYYHAVPPEPTWNHHILYTRTYTPTWNYGAKTFTIPLITVVDETGEVGSTFNVSGVAHTDYQTYLINYDQYLKEPVDNKAFYDSVRIITLSELFTTGDLSGWVDEAVSLGDAAFDDWTFQYLYVSGDACIASSGTSSDVVGFRYSKGSYRTRGATWFSDGLSSNTEAGLGDLWNGNFNIHCIIRVRQNLPIQRGTYYTIGAFSFLSSSYTNDIGSGTATETLSESIDDVYLANTSLGDTGESWEVSWTGGLSILDDYPWVVIDPVDPYSLIQFMASQEGEDGGYAALAQLMFISRDGFKYRFTLTTLDYYEVTADIVLTTGSDGRVIYSNIIPEVDYYAMAEAAVTKIERQVRNKKSGSLEWVEVASKESYDQWVIEMVQYYEQYAQYQTDYDNWVDSGSDPDYEPEKPDKPPTQLDPMTLVGSNIGDRSLVLIVVGKYLLLSPFGYYGFVEGARYRTRGVSISAESAYTTSLTGSPFGCDAGPLSDSTMDIETTQTWLKGVLQPLVVVSYTRTILGLSHVSDERQAQDANMPSWPEDSLSDSTRVLSQIPGSLTGAWLPPERDSPDPDGPIVSETVVTLPAIIGFEGFDYNGIDWSAVMGASAGTSAFFEGFTLSYA